MRELQTSDIFGFVRLINKAGIKDEIKKKVLEIEDISKVNTESLGYDILLMIIEKAADNEEEVYEFFSGILEKSVDEIRTMDAIEFLETITKVASIERWKVFFQSAAKLMK